MIMIRCRETCLSLLSLLLIASSLFLLAVMMLRRHNYPGPGIRKSFSNILITTNEEGEQEKGKKKENMPISDLETWLLKIYSHKTKK